MALAQEKLYTIDDIYALPDGERAELIDGELYMMSPPGTTHQRIVSFLNRTIGNYIQEQNGDCEIFLAPFAVFLNNDEHTQGVGQNVQLALEVHRLCGQNRQAAEYQYLKLI